MEFHEVKQRLFVDGALEDIKVIHEQLGGLHPDEEPAARWETLRSAFETNGFTHQWSPWAAYLVAYLDTLPPDERPRVVEHHEALLDSLTAQVLAMYQPDSVLHQAGHTEEAVDQRPAGQALSPHAFTADALWAALSAEMTHKAGTGDVPAIPGTARAVAKRLVEVAWNAALGQHQASDAVDVWIHRCLDGAQRNVGADLSQPQVVDALRADRRAFFALREAMEPTAELLVAARTAAEVERKRPRKAVEVEQAQDDDPLDGVSLQILFGEVDMATILDDDTYAEAMIRLVANGVLQLTTTELDSLPDTP